MRRGLKRILKATVAAGFVLVLLVGGALAALAFYDWNHARDWIAGKISDRTGREFVIAGNLEVHPFSLYPRVRAERVTFANADWGENRPMLQAGAVAFNVSLTRFLFHGRVVVPWLEITDADVLLQRAEDGRRNWILKPPEETAQGESPEIYQLVANNSRIRVKDRPSDTEVSAVMQSRENGIYGIDVAAQGKVRGVPLKVSGNTGGLLLLMDEDEPYPLRLKGTLGDSTFSAEGSVRGVSGKRNLDVAMTLSGGNLAPLGDVLNISLPDTKPYRLAGTLERRGPDWTFRQFRGTVGKSDLGGDFKINVARDRPLLTGDLKSTNLDLADLGGFVGAKPSSPKPSTAPGKVLPSAPFNLDKLRRVDARVRFLATRFRNADELPLDNLDATLRLENGELKLEPLLFGVAQGKVRSLITVNAREPTLRGTIDAAFTKLLLSKLIPAAKKLEQSLGAVDGRLKLAGAGNSTATMLGSSSGRIDLYSNGGEVSNLLLEFAGADLAEIARFWVGGDKKIQLRCAVASFGVQDGVATSQTIVVDTDDTLIGGKGQASLREESLDFTLTPLPKDFSILALRGPLRVEGSFAKPSFGLEKGALARKSGAAVLLGLINPLAALIPLIETGPGKDAHCAELVAQVNAVAKSQPRTSAHLVR